MYDEIVGFISIRSIADPQGFNFEPLLTDPSPNPDMLSRNTRGPSAPSAGYCDRLSHGLRSTKWFELVSTLQDGTTSSS